MEFSAKVRKYGNQNWQVKTILLPDICQPYFELYNLEIIELHDIKCMCLFFQSKTQPEIDIVSYTIYRPEIKQNLSNGFRDAFALLETHLHPVTESTEIPEQIYGV